MAQVIDFFRFEIDYVRRVKYLRCDYCGERVDNWVSVPRPTDEMVVVSEIIRVVSDHWESRHR